MANEKNNGKHKGHQDPQPGHGNDQKGHKGNGGGNPPIRPTKPGNSHGIFDYEQFFN